jgi:putative oxidoreductase
MALLTDRGITLDIGLLVLRVAGGLMMAGHGYGKVQKLLAGDYGFPDPLGIGPAASLVLAALAEFVCALLVVVGLKTRWNAIPIVVTMLVAGLIVHAEDPWGDKEPALLFAAAFLALVFTGGGRFAIDALFGRSRS